MTLVRTRNRNRRGFSVIMVIVAITLIMGFWVVAYRQTGSLIRVESSRLLSQKRAEQSIHAMTALDRALTLLEVSKPPERKIYVYTVTLPALETFTVTYTPSSLPGASDGWTVRVTPGSTVANPALPDPSASAPTW